MSQTTNPFAQILKVNKQKKGVHHSNMYHALLIGATLVSSSIVSDHLSDSDSTSNSPLEGTACSMPISLFIMMHGTCMLIACNYTAAEHTLNTDSSGDLDTSIQQEGYPSQQPSILL